LSYRRDSMKNEYSGAHALEKAGVHVVYGVLGLKPNQDTLGRVAGPSRASAAMPTLAPGNYKRARRP